MSGGQSPSAHALAGEPVDANSCFSSGRAVAIPRSLADASRVVTLAAGPTHCLAVDVSSRAWAWGSNESGQLGIGSAGGAVAEPALVAKEGTRFLAAAAGFAHSLLLDHEGRVWAFGSNLYAQLGLPDAGRTAPVTSPAKVDALEEAGILDPATGTFSGVAAIAAGARHSAAVCKGGEVYTWGTDTHGQLAPRSPDGVRPAPRGASDIVNAIKGLHTATPVEEPERVQLPGLEWAERVACGPRWTRVWGKDEGGAAREWAWGENERGCSPPL